MTEDVLEAFTAHLRAAGARGVYRQQLHPVDQGASTVGWRRRAIGSAPAVSGEADGLRRGKATKRHRRLVPDTIDAHGKVTQEGEERRLLKAASPWLQRLIMAAIETGCRRGELLGLTWGDVDLTRGELTVTGDTNKTGQGRAIPISPRLRAVLDLLKLDPTGKERPRHASSSSAMRSGKRWRPRRRHGRRPCSAPTASSRRGPPRAASRPTSRAGAQAIDLHFHDLRHEAGSRMLEAGWPLHHVQRMLGHADVKQTATYLNAERVGLARLDEAVRDDPCVAIRGNQLRPESNRHLATTRRRKRRNRRSTNELRVASPAGLEPATPGLGNRCSILLSYGDVRFLLTNIR